MVSDAIIAYRMPVGWHEVILINFLTDSKKMREIDEIIIHATATNPSWMADKPVDDVVAEIRSWHVEERKWSDVGYHAIIHRDGAVGYGRPVGAHRSACRGPKQDNNRCKFSWW